MEKFELLPFDGPEALAAQAAALWLDEIESARRAGKPYCVALSGGRIAHQFFSAAVDQAQARGVGFEGIHFFWADERCVPPSDPESNFRTASELLLGPLKIPAEQIHRIRGEEDPAGAAARAAEELCQIAGQNSGGIPVIDLVILGMGEDGHVASLFQNAIVRFANCKDFFVFVDDSRKPPPRRISLNVNVIAVAAKVWVMVSGAGKQPALKESLDGKGQTPLARVIQAREWTRIFSDVRI
ncbi:MAG TPA: 6-phosphogluconolactonase [Verrucomicrobiae bacterium]|nr:6-phosphogluconolactonase [Verrucomicrobiae bacterium]